MVTISLSGPRAVSLIEDFDKAGIYYEKRRPNRAADLMTAPQWILDLARFAQAHTAWDLLVAPVLIAWLKAKAQRKITFIMNDATTCSAEGLSAKEFETILRNAKSLLAVEAGTAAKLEPPQRAKTKSKAGRRRHGFS